MNKIEKLYTAYRNYCKRELFPEPTREEFENGEIAIAHSSLEISPNEKVRSNAPENIKKAYGYKRNEDEEVFFGYSYDWKNETEKIWFASAEEGDPDITIPFPVDVMAEDLEIVDFDIFYNYVCRKIREFFEED